MLNFCYWVRGAEFADLCAKSASSIRRQYPSARVFVYTDEAHEALKNPVFSDVFIVPAFNETPAMLANLQTQVHFCLSKNFTAPTMFLDADVLAVQFAPELEDPEFWKDKDLFVTQRDHVGFDEKGNKVVGVAREMPYNYGVLGVNNTTGGLEAMIALRSRVAKFGGTYQKWYGNQWALRELVGGSCTDPSPRDVSRHIGFWAIKIHVAPCDTWNFTPESVDEDLDGAYFVHTKGDRKDMFNALAERFS